MEEPGGGERGTITEEHDGWADCTVRDRVSEWNKPMDRGRETGGQMNHMTPLSRFPICSVEP